MKMHPIKKRNSNSRSYLNRCLAFFYYNIYLIPIILPVILGAIYIKLFGVNVVFWDQWGLVPLIEKVHTGTLTFGDLFVQHNEHRIFFPRIIMLAMAYITQYNTIAEMYFSWILVIISFVLIFRMYRSDFGISASAMIKFVPIAWIMFSFRQFENILWGWQISIYLSVLGFVAAIYLLDESEKRANRFIMAIICGIISTFSFFNGLFVWPVGLVFIILSKIKNRRTLAIVWAIIGILVWSIYLYNWTKPSYHPSLLFALGHFNSSLTYLFVNIGAPLAFELNYAFGIGVIVAIICLVVLIFIIKNRLIARYAKWLSFILFSFLSSLALTIGRSGFGVEQALSSRYVTLTLLGIVGLYLIINDLNYNFNYNNKSIKYNSLYWVILSIILVGIIVGYFDGIKEGGNVLEGRKLMVNSLINYEGTSDENLKELFPWPDIVRERAKILEEYRLNVFVSSQTIPEWQFLKRAQGGIMAIDTVDKKLYSNESNKIYMNRNINQSADVSGWAADDLTKDGEVKTFIVFRSGNEEVVIPTRKTHRPDVAEHFKVESYTQSGWSATISSKGFKNKCYNISIRILRSNSREYYELNGDKPICFGLN